MGNYVLSRFSKLAAVLSFIIHLMYSGKAIHVEVTLDEPLDLCNLRRLELIPMGTGFFFYKASTENKSSFSCSNKMALFDVNICH